MEDLRRSLLILILSRPVLAIPVVGAVVLGLLPGPYPAAELLLPFTLVICILTALYALLWRYSDRPGLLYNLQFYLDLFLVSALSFSTGGINSPFIPFYVLLIVYASLMRGREGGILALFLSLISYVGIVHLGYLGWVPGAEQVDPYGQIVLRITLNVLAFLAVAGLGIYLSERLRRAHRELGAARVLHENIVDSLRAGLLTLDLSGRITSLNQAARDILGFGAKELMLKPLSLIFPQALMEQTLQSDFERTPLPLRMQAWIRNKRKESLFLGMSCSPLKSQHGEKIGYIISFQDLTEIKKREEELQVKEKMAAIGQMAADLAHEIRNPLGSLYGSMQILQKELHLSDDRARLAQIVLRECERLNTIVADFLSYAGPHSPRLQPVDLRPLVEETAELLKNSPEFADHHRLEVSCAEDGAICRGDPNQLRQVTWNILTNGVRAMPRGGRLTVLIQNHPSTVLVRFTDEGMGMAEEERQKLFQPFHSSFRKGVGLGMAIVYQVIQSHGGRIDVRSKQGRGTEIEVWLPRWKPAGRLGQSQASATTQAE